jgi:hypothetical protein
MPTTREQRERHAFCGAKKKNGETCRNYAGLGTDHVGVGQCKFHLGNAEPNRKAAIKEMARRRAAALEGEALLFGQTIKIEPLDALLWTLYLSASHMEYLRQEIAAVEDEQAFNTQVLLRQWTDERERLAKTAKMALDAGVAERQVTLAERLGELLARLIQGILTDLELTPKQQERAPEIVRRNLVAVEGERPRPLAELLPAAPAAAKG